LRQFTNSRIHQFTNSLIAVSLPIILNCVFETLALPPSLPLADAPSPCEELPRLGRALQCPARVLIKRDDTIAFAFGGNKVRKLRFVAAHAKESGADTLITTGSVQSNHARVTAAVAARLGMKCILVVNGVRPVHATGNALLDQLLGAEIRYVVWGNASWPGCGLRAGRVANAGDRHQRRRTGGITRGDRPTIARRSREAPGVWRRTIRIRVRCG
jgi:pyridoxal-phosphate dependent enzyme